MIIQIVYLIRFIAGIGLLPLKILRLVLRASKPRKNRRRYKKTRARSGKSISKAEAVRRFALTDPTLGGTLGQRKNDDLVRELLVHGHKRLVLDTSEAKAMLEKITADPRLKLTDASGRKMSISRLKAEIRRMELSDNLEEKQKD
jgi:hypothetical protein